MWKTLCVWVWDVLEQQEGDKDVNAAAPLLQGFWQIVSRLLIYESFLKLSRFSAEEGVLSGLHLILWQIQKWRNAWGTNKWVSTLPALLCWQCISQHFTNFLGLYFSKEANARRFTSVRHSEVFTRVKDLHGSLILHSFDTVVNGVLQILSYFYIPFISPVSCFVSYFLFPPRRQPAVLIYLYSHVYYEVI